MSAERQPAPWLAPGTIQKLGRIAPRERPRRVPAHQRRLPWDTRRALLLEACLNAFVARGLEMTTMDTIAAQAGVSKPLVYRHFHNRFEALLAVVEQQSQLLQRQLGLDLAPAQAVDFDSLVTGFLRFARESPTGFRLLFQLVDASAGPAKRRLDSLRLELGAALTVAMLARVDDPEEVMTKVTGSGLGHLMLSILVGVAGGLSRGEDPDLVARTLHRLLRPDWVMAALVPTAAEVEPLLLPLEPA